MTSFKKIQKSHSKIYKERAQPAHREHLGILTKKKDFQQVSELRNNIKAQYIEKEKLIQQRNPDEFYYKMLRKDKKPEDAYTPEQVMEYMSKDLKYIDTRLCMESRKIEKLKSYVTMPYRPAVLTRFVDDRTIDVASMREEVKVSASTSAIMAEQVSVLTELAERQARAKELEVMRDTMSCKLLVMKRSAEGKRKCKIVREASRTEAPILKWR